MTDPAPRSDVILPKVTIPSGLATQLGVYGTSVMAIVALVTAVLDGDHTPETLIALVTATIILATTIYGRMKQAAAIYESVPSPVQGILEAIDVITAPISPSGTTVPPGTTGTSSGTTLGGKRTNT
jgi:hypothetical protein